MLIKRSDPSIVRGDFRFRLGVLSKKIQSKIDSSPQIRNLLEIREINFPIETLLGGEKDEANDEGAKARSPIEIACAWARAASHLLIDECYARFFVNEFATMLPRLAYPLSGLYNVFVTSLAAMIRLSAKNRLRVLRGLGWCIDTVGVSRVRIRYCIPPYD